MNTIYARVIAIPIQFPGEIDLRYQVVDRSTGENEGGTFGSDHPLPWAKIIQELSLDSGRVAEYEKQMKQGLSTVVSEPRECLGEWYGIRSVSTLIIRRRPAE